MKPFSPIVAKNTVLVDKLSKKKAHVVISKFQYYTTDGKVETSFMWKMAKTLKAPMFMFWFFKGKERDEDTAWLYTYFFLLFAAKNLGTTIFEVDYNSLKYIGYQYSIVFFRKHLQELHRLRLINYSNADKGYHSSFQKNAEITILPIPPMSHFSNYISPLMPEDHAKEVIEIPFFMLFSPSMIEHFKKGNAYAWGRQRRELHFVARCILNHQRGIKHGLLRIPGTYFNEVFSVSVRDGVDDFKKRFFGSVDKPMKTLVAMSKLYSEKRLTGKEGQNASIGRHVLEFKIDYNHEHTAYWKALKIRSDVVEDSKNPEVVIKRQGRKLLFPFSDELLLINLGTKGSNKRLSTPNEFIKEKLKHDVEGLIMCLETMTEFKETFDGTDGFVRYIADNNRLGYYNRLAPNEDIREVKISKETIVDELFTKIKSLGFLRLAPLADGIFDKHHAKVMVPLDIYEEAVDQLDSVLERRKKEISENTTALMKKQEIIHSLIGEPLLKDTQLAKEKLVGFEINQTRNKTKTRALSGRVYEPERKKNDYYPDIGKWTSIEKSNEFVKTYNAAKQKMKKTANDTLLLQLFESLAVFDIRLSTRVKDAYELREKLKDYWKDEEE